MADATLFLLEHSDTLDMSGNHGIKCPKFNICGATELNNLELAQMIADALNEKSFKIDKRKVELEEQIKTLGIYSVNIKLHPKVGSKIKVWVVRE